MAATRALVGSGDDRFLDAIRIEFGDDLTRDDDRFSYVIRQGAPRTHEAMRAVIHGGTFSEIEDHSFQYGYAYKWLCSVTGSFLENGCFTPHRSDWLSVLEFFKISQRRRCP